MSGVVRLIASYDMFFEPFMYTERIFSPYGSASKRPRMGMLSALRTCHGPVRTRAGSPVKTAVQEGHVRWQVLVV
jgi:hypothetical protein